MSLLTKSANTKTTKQQKIKLTLKVEKSVSGLLVTVKSKELGQLVKDFLNRYSSQRNKSFDYYPNPSTIYMSIHWGSYYRNNRLMYDDIINLNILSNYEDSASIEQQYLINNVFTNDEIKAYIDKFEKIVRKMKELVNEPKKETKKRVGKLNLANGNTISYGYPYTTRPSDFGCSDGSCDICNREYQQQIIREMESVG